MKMLKLFGVVLVLLSISGCFSTVAMVGTTVATTVLTEYVSQRIVSDDEKPEPSR